MKFSIALFGHDNSQISVILLGEKKTEDDAHALLASSGSGEHLVEIAEFDCDDSRVFHALGCSPGDGGPGSKLEEFAQFCFDLGRKMR